MKLRFIGSENVLGDVKSFVFEATAPLNWKPGQYIHYTLPHANQDDRGDERWFTISSAPSEQSIKITTRINAERSSSFKSALQDLKPGDEIDADQPEGDFTVDDTTKNYIFVAGGIGITPFRSILTEAEKQNQKLNVNLLYGNRNQDTAFADELNKLAKNNPNLKIEYIVSPEKIEAVLIKQRFDSLKDPAVYVSGPEPMVESLVEELSKLGIDEKNIKADYFPGYKAQ